MPDLTKYARIDTEFTRFDSQQAMRSAFIKLNAHAVEIGKEPPCIMEDNEIYVNRNFLAAVAGAIEGGLIDWDEIGD